MTSRVATAIERTRVEVGVHWHRLCDRLAEDVEDHGFTMGDRRPIDQVGALLSSSYQFQYGSVGPFILKRDRSFAWSARLDSFRQRFKIHFEILEEPTEGYGVGIGF